MNTQTIPPEMVRLVLGLLCLAAFVGLNALVLVYLERKVAGFIQRRPGPYKVGPQGLLQTLCDAVKLVGKQLTRPTGADAFLYWAAPFIAFLPVFVLFLPVPFGKDIYALNVNLGLILILAFAGFGSLSLIIAGFSSNNKWGLIGAARSVAQTVAYEIPLLLSVLAVAFMAGSLDLQVITESQGPWPWQWNIVLQPVAFFIYFTSALGETNRAPFDLPEAESELTAGFHTEYSGMGFGLFFLAEYANMIVVCSVATILFLGGWHGPFVSGPWWFLIKVYALLICMMWFRWTYPRVRFDQLLNLNWKILLPLAMANLMITAILIKVF